MGEVMRQRRHDLGMSQADLASAAGVGVRQIRRYEAGEQQPVQSRNTWRPVVTCSRLIGRSIDREAR